MFQPPRKKYLIGLDRYIFNDKKNPNNYLYVQIHNGLNSNKSKNQNSQKSLKKSSSQFSVNKNNHNKSNKNNNYGINKNISPNNVNQNKKSSSVKPIHNIKSYNKKNNYYKFLLNSSAYDKNNKKSNSLYKDRNMINGKYNIKIDKNGSSFINTQRSKTPMSNKENNGRIILNYKNKSQNNNGGYHDNKANKPNKSKINLLENKSMRNCNNSIFQPINIFSQFKKNRGNNNDELIKNTQLLKKFLQDNKQKNDIDKNRSFKISNNFNNKTRNNNNILIENNYNNFSQNIINKTNDTTPINSNNLINSKLNNNNNRIIVNNINNSKNINNHISTSNYANNVNNNHLVNNNNLNISTSLNNNTSINNNGSIIFDKNDYVKEINFQVNGISSTKHGKKRIFKGKKIKCMHDLSKTGLSGDDKKVNQDNYFIFKNFVQGFENIYMGVCDGHGYYGHEVSGYIKENLPMDLNHMIKTKKLNILKDDISSIIKTAFILENKSLLRNKQIDSDLSGSTCVSVIYTPQKLIIANIGDSRCVLGKCIEPDKDEEIFSNIHEESNPKKSDIKKWVALNLSRDHKPTIPEEAQRILKTGGRIRQMKDDDGEFIGPLRVYMKEKDMPGLAMTRSFGDYFGSTAGVISEPEVTEYYLKEEDKFMVLASDGLFEFMESQEVVEIIKDYYEKNDIVGCCEYLYKESTIKWLREEEDTIDDITIILVFFEDYFDEVD